MDRLDPLDAAFVEMEPRIQPQHVAAVLILSRPDDAGPDYVDDVYRAALASTAPIRSAASPLSPSRQGHPRHVGLA